MNAIPVSCTVCDHFGHTCTISFILSGNGFHEKKNALLNEFDVEVFYRTNCSNSVNVNASSFAVAATAADNDGKLQQPKQQQNLFNGDNSYKNKHEKNAVLEMVAVIIISLTRHTF